MKKVAPPPRVSIVIPMFNVEKYVGICIESILAQTFSDFEVIIVNDCSTDRSVEVIESFDDPRITLLHNLRNLGAGFTRNVGLQIARGKYVYFLDPDDAMLKNNLEIFYKAIEESQADVVYMNRCYLAEDADFKLSEKIKIQRVTAGSNQSPRFFSSNIIERLQQEYFRAGVMVQPWIKIQRRDFLFDNNIYFPKTPRLDDMLFNFAEICFGRKMQVIDACCYVNRPNPTSIMHQSAENHLRKTFQSMPETIRFMEEVMDSPKILQPIPKEFQIQVECRILLEFFQAFLHRAYDSMPMEEVNSIMIELLSETMDQNLTRALIHTIRYLMTNRDKIIEGRG